MDPGIRTVTLGGSNPSTEGLETWENDVASPPNSRPKSALEALVGDQTLAELAGKHHLHPNVIAQWKRQARESLPEVFARKTSSGAADHEAEVKALHAKIGQLTVENDFLSRAFGR